MDDRHLGELARRARPRTACRRAAIHSACAAGAVLLLQGVVEIVRCLICIRDGVWPAREEDVEEVDVDKLKAMVTHHEEENAAR